MFSLDQLVENVAACQMGRMSLDDFEDWFRSNSHGAYQDPVLSEAFFAVEEVFSTELHGMKGEQVFEELGRAVRPFALGPVYSPAREFVYGKPSQKAFSANRLHSLVMATAV